MFETLQRCGAIAFYLFSLRPAISFLNPELYPRREFAVNTQILHIDKGCVGRKESFTCALYSLEHNTAGNFSFPFSGCMEAWEKSLFLIVVLWGVRQDVYWSLELLILNIIHSFVFLLQQKHSWIRHIPISQQNFNPKPARQWSTVCGEHLSSFVLHTVAQRAECSASLQ